MPTYRESWNSSGTQQECHWASRSSESLRNAGQCLSASEWANVGEHFVAAPIEDLRLAEEVSRFAARHGIGVISFGLSEDVLDDMPKPAAATAVNNDFARFESWISRCLLEERIISAREFDDLGRAAAKTARDYVA
ncbi:MAG: hypothetical protein DVB23_001056 [Verrucomicrobia bacterium]|jgi:hypothetical protein|nr:MAG: hypothetical protein DVB23_001056 [Verrucomicrobiota bacterium]